MFIDRNGWGIAASNVKETFLDFQIFECESRHKHFVRVFIFSSSFSSCQFRLLIRSNSNSTAHADIRSCNSAEALCNNMNSGNKNQKRIVWQIMATKLRTTIVMCHLGSRYTHTYTVSYPKNVSATTFFSISRCPFHSDAFCAVLLAPRAMHFGSKLSRDEAQ